MEDDCHSVEEIKEALQNNDRSLAAERIQKYLDTEKNIRLNIAITGETGAGKSSFVNAFRGIDNSDEGAAPTGAVETTMEPTPYPHPNYPNVTLWDLPGIGTTRFPADKYLKHVGFKKFDFFIIISCTRFTENDVKLAKEIQKMKKNFYFVRSKIDNDLDGEKRSKKEKFNEESTLKQIRENCITGLQKQGIESPQFFLVSNFDFKLYDFQLLQRTFRRELPKHKRKVLLLATPNVNLEIINEKKEALQSKIKYYATLSAAAAAVPVPGLSIAVDIGVIIGVVTQYVFAFGLDIPSLKRLAQITGVPYKDVISVILSPLAASEITHDLIMKVLQGVGSAALLMAAEEGSRFIPILGIPLAMGFSFTSTYRVLHTFLDKLADDAERVFHKTLGRNSPVLK